MDVLQTVVGGSDGCLFSYGYAGLGRLSLMHYKQNNKYLMLF